MSSLSSSTTTSYRQRGLRGTRVSVSRAFNTGGRSDRSPLPALHRRDADPENPELALGFQHVPGGELERHLRHRFDVFIELGQHCGQSELLEPDRCADVNDKQGELV